MFRNNINQLEDLEDAYVLYEVKAAWEYTQRKVARLNDDDGRNQWKSRQYYEDNLDFPKAFEYDMEWKIPIPQIFMGFYYKKLFDIDYNLNRAIKLNDIEGQKLRPYEHENGFIYILNYSIIKSFLPNLIEHILSYLYL